MDYRVPRAAGGPGRRRAPSAWRCEAASAAYLWRFEALVAEARDAHPEHASSLLREALALWRGRPLAEFDEPFARIEGGRLEDLRLAAIEQRIEADLALGGEADLIGELEALIVENPTREKLRVDSCSRCTASTPGQVLLRDPQPQRRAG